MNKVLFVSSKGGHFDELLKLKPTMQQYDSVIVVEKCATNHHVDYFLSAGTRANMIKYPFILLINFIKAYKILKKEQPDVIISTGAHSAVPFFILGRSKKIYIESFAVFEGSSLTYKIIKNKCDHVIVQQENMLKEYENAKYFGGVY